jgi:hypothetical protein
MNAQSAIIGNLADFDSVAASHTGAGHLSGLLGKFLLKNSLRQVQETYADTSVPENNTKDEFAF